MNRQPKYVVITPVRDEEKYLEKTIQSIIAQTILPSEWVIVDDGSTDNTGAIIEAYARQYGWIRPLRRENRGFRKAGGGVIDAFYDGYNSMATHDWDFVVKLDGDLSFGPTYFQACLDHFRDNGKLGIGGGAICYVVEGRVQIERTPKFHVRGATKIYRRECWAGIGGLLSAPGWDTVDEVKANMLGWQTATFEGLTLIHHRFTGSADGTLRDLVKHGRANYVAGYHPLFLCLKAVKRMIQPPFVLGSLALVYGFISGYSKGIRRVDDPELIRYLRKEQMNRLLLRPSIWK